MNYRWCSFPNDNSPVSRFLTALRFLIVSRISNIMSNITNNAVLILHCQLLFFPLNGKKKKLITIKINTLVTMSDESLREKSLPLNLRSDDSEGKVGECPRRRCRPSRNGGCHALLLGGCGQHSGRLSRVERRPGRWGSAAWSP